MKDQNLNNYKEITLEKLEKALEQFSEVKDISNELFLFSARLSYLKKDYKTAKKFTEKISSKIL